MAINITLEVERVMDSGECVIIGYEADAQGKKKANGRAHGETVYCKTAHTHSKACAQALLDQPITAEVRDAQNAVVTPAGPLVRAAITAWFAAEEAKPVVVPVALPKKSVQVIEDGKQVTKQVDDKDLA